MFLSLDQTQELLRIVASDNPTEELEEFIAQYGYDEGTDEDLTYEEVIVSFTHRYNSGLVR